MAIFKCKTRKVLKHLTGRGHEICDVTNYVSHEDSIALPDTREPYQKCVH